MPSSGPAADSEALRNAYRLHQAGRLGDAARAYGEVLDANPTHFDALFLLGLIHLQCGHPEEAERVFSRAVTSNPASLDALSARVTALQQLGRHAEALACLDSLLTAAPANPIPWCNRGNSLLALERRTEAVASYDRAIALKPDYAEAWHNRAVAKLMQQDYAGAEADLERALAIKPDYPDALEHLGVARAAVGRHEQALGAYDAAVRLMPDRAELLCRRADCLLQLARLEDAVAGYERSLALAPDNGDAWHNRGVALSRLSRLGEAVESYDRALQLRGDFAEGWLNRGSALLEQNRRDEALASYDRALASRRDYAQAWKSRGVVLVLLQRHGEALAAFDLAVALQPGDAECWEGRGNALFRLNRAEEALSSYDEALRLSPDRADALFNRATVCSHLKRFREAADDCERLLALDPAHPYARGLLVSARLNLCDWRGLAAERVRISEGLHAGRRVIYPFAHLAVSDSPSEQLDCARIFVGSNIPPVTAPLWGRTRNRHERIRVAYLSADFYTHATAFLMAGVFEHHDRARFETYAFSYGLNDNSAMRARLEGSFHDFFDVAGESNADIARRVRDHDIDIAVDLKGYTGSARPGILAFRPAPVQVHYLGYPGSTGTDTIDYLIADRVVIPDDERKFYAEQIAYLPDSYQCNDRKRPLPARAPTRAQAGLPETGFVFCCFNASHKISPELFDIWMRLLRDVASSALWLFAESDDAIANLRREARQRGVAEHRLIFAARASLEEHLARLSLADLVLDTLPYGAHTTASDALWAGVPVLTARGSTFAGRVAASLLAAVGLPDLITPSLEDYETRAKALAANPGALGALRAKLARNRDGCPLFDTERITRHLEAAYTAMWERYQRGETPASFSVTAAGGVQPV